MDLNNIVFGGITVFSAAVFFYFGRFRASSKQRDRNNRIDWHKPGPRFMKPVLLGMLAILVVSIIARLLT